MQKHQPPSWKVKAAPEPYAGENLKSYGDRLLWHQLGLQLNDLRDDMLTEDDFVSAVTHFFPNAVVQNVRQYRSYFNGIHKSMGFREHSKMPIAVEFIDL